MNIKGIMMAAVAAFWLTPDYASASSLILTEGVAGITNDPEWVLEFYGVKCDICYVTADVELSTEDNWNTATIKYTAYTDTDALYGFFLYPRSINFGLSSISGDAVDLGSGEILVFPQLNGIQYSFEFQALNLPGSPVPLWDVLSTDGLDILQCWFGCEQGNGALVQIQDRSVESYSFPLWEESLPAPIPLPAALPPLWAGLAGLGLIGYRRRKNY